MTGSEKTSVQQVVVGLLALVGVAVVVVALVYGLSRLVTGTVGGAVAGGMVGLAVTLVTKSLDHRRQRETAIAEKKREVYRGVLAPYEKVLASVAGGKKGDEILAAVDLDSLYSSAFDAVLYGSEDVVQKYVAFRTPDAKRDGIDTLRALAQLLIAMREDVTGRRAALAVEDVLGTFVNFGDADRLALRLREHVAASPEAQDRLRSALRGAQEKAKLKV